MAPFLIPIVSMLADKGMSLLSSAVEGGADKAVEYVSEKTGIDLSTKSELTSAEILQLKQLEAQDRVKLEELALAAKKEGNRHDEAITKASHDNTANARDMQKAALEQEDLFSKRFVYYFIAVWSIFAMVYIGFVTFGTIPPENVRFADTIIGFLLGTGVASIFNYMVGSTKGSKDKDEHIKRLTVSSK